MHQGSSRGRRSGPWRRRFSRVRPYLPPYVEPPEPPHPAPFLRRVIEGLRALPDYVPVVASAPRTPLVRALDGQGPATQEIPLVIGSGVSWW